MKRIFIVGKGWLGSQLFDYFQERGDKVSASITKKSFKEGSPNLYSFDLGDDPLELINWNFIDVIIFTIPPSSSERYALESIAFFRKVIAVNPKLKIIYTSSISIYGNQNGDVNEESEVSPQSESALKINEVENYLIPNKNTSILRLGGLVGPNRHPVYSLASKSKKIANPDQSINLIHSEDVIYLISKLVGGEFSFILANLCTPDHPTKREYYSAFASKLELKLPEFEQYNERKGKIVNSKVLDELGYKFIFDSAFEYNLD